MKQLTAAQFHKFDGTDGQPIFIGEYVDTSKRFEDQDPKEGKGKKGDVNGYIFEDENGTQVVIGNSKAVVDAMGQVKEGDILGFKFLGQRKTRSKQNFNSFQIILFDSFEEANDYYYPSVSEKETLK